MSATSSQVAAGASTTANVLQLAEAVLTQIPLCAQATAMEGISASGCGLDILCLCTDDNFLDLLQGVIETNCSAADGEKSLDLASQLCTTADPSLKDSRTSMIIAVTAILMVLAGSAVVGRLVARRISGARILWDDYLIMAALALTYALNVTCLIGVHLGYGRHIITLSLSDIAGFAKTYWVTQLLFACAITTTKLSILFFYHRIFPSRDFRNTAIIIGVLTVAWWISLEFAVIFSCRPVQYYWDRTIPGGSCIDINSLAYGITGANFITDLVVWLLPVPWLWGLQMQLSRKLAIIGIFLLGGLVCVAGIIRLPLLLELNEADLTWTVIAAGIWINVECNLGVVCACLPIMRPLFKWATPFASLRSRFLKYSRSKSYSDDNSGFKSLSSEHIVSDHISKTPIKQDSMKLENVGWYTAAMPSVTDIEDEG